MKHQKKEKVRGRRQTVASPPGNAERLLAQDAADVALSAHPMGGWAVSAPTGHVVFNRVSTFGATGQSSGQAGRPIASIKMSPYIIYNQKNQHAQPELMAWGEP